jgi:hypothetical protein
MLGKMKEEKRRGRKRKNKCNTKGKKAIQKQRRE